MFKFEVFREQMYCIEENILVTLLGLFGAPRSDSAPVELCPPRCAPGGRASMRNLSRVFEDRYRALVVFGSLVETCIACLYSNQNMDL